jgi:hypothetical protein
MAKRNATTTSSISDKAVTVCSYCTRPAHSQIVANNQIYCGKLCAAMGLITEVHQEDAICVDVYDVGFYELLDMFFREGPLPIPVKVRCSDAAERGVDAPAPEGFAFVAIPIEDEQGTPDWIPPEGKYFTVDQDEIDHAVDDLLRNGTEPEGRP